MVVETYGALGTATLKLVKEVAEFQSSLLENKGVPVWLRMKEHISFHVFLANTVYYHNVRFGKARDEVVGKGGEEEEEEEGGEEEEEEEGEDG